MNPTKTPVYGMVVPAPQMKILADMADIPLPTLQEKVMLVFQNGCQLALVKCIREKTTLYVITHITPAKPEKREKRK
jgi:hypothetical protein